MTLTEFLTARIAEDEVMANQSLQIGDKGVALLRIGAPDAPPTMIVHPWRMLAECEAKRRIVERCAAVDYAMPSTHLAHGVLAEMALPYADHPDYDQAWKSQPRT